MDILMQAVMNAGLPAGLVLYFVWWGGQREKRLEERLNLVEDDQKTLLAGVVRDNTLAMQAMADGLTRMTDRMGMTATLRVGRGLEREDGA